MKQTIGFLDVSGASHELIRSHFSGIFNIRIFSNPDRCLQFVRNNSLPVLITNENVLQQHGAAFLNEVAELNPSTRCIIAVNKKNLGIADGLGSQVNCSVISVAKFKDALPKVRDLINLILLRNSDGQHTNGKSADACPEIITRDAAMKERLDYARRIANAAEAVLITGPTGTGKELFARYIHFHSQRHPLQFVNCAAISAELFESEFFGHKKGAFTGADSARDGHFVQANNGTLVLDEISEMDLRFQAKLLRAIENQEIFPVGSQQLVKLNTRIIALSNRDLRKEVTEGRFRADLFHRLNLHAIDLLPIRKRKQDIKPLLEFFLGQTWLSLVPDWRSCIDSGVYELLSRARLDGNVRDLRNVASKLLANIGIDHPEITSDAVRDILGVSAMPSVNDTTEDLKSYLQRMAMERIRVVLAENGQNLSKAAIQLGLSRQSLQYRLRQLNEAG